MYVLVLQNTCNVGKTKSEYLISLKKETSVRFLLYWFFKFMINVSLCLFVVCEIFFAEFANECYSFFNLSFCITYVYISRFGE